MENLDINDKIRIKRPDGQIEEYKILLSYHSDQYDRNYIMVYEEDDFENVLLFEYFDDGTLEIVNDEDVLIEAQQVLNRYEDEIESSY